MYNLEKIYFVLTHLPLDKIAVILADDTFKCIFLSENDRIPIQMSLKFVARIPVDNKPVLVQVMAWCRTGDKLLPEPMMTQFTDAYMWHLGEMSNWTTQHNQNLTSVPWPQPNHNQFV